MVSPLSAPGGEFGQLLLTAGSLAVMRDGNEREGRKEEGAINLLPSAIFNSNYSQSEPRVHPTRVTIIVMGHSYRVGWCGRIKLVGGLGRD